jgi:hypothetical protein
MRHLMLISAALLIASCAHQHPLVLPGDTTWCAMIREASITRGDAGYPELSCRYIESVVGGPPAPSPGPYIPTGPIICNHMPGWTTCSR